MGSDDDQLPQLETFTKAAEPSSFTAAKARGLTQMIDFLIAAAIASAVLAAARWLLSRIHRADERRVTALASRLNCPTCGVSDFVWTEQWAVNESDMEEEVGGDTLLCNQCGKEFHFTDDGKEFHHPSLGDPPEG